MINNNEFDYINNYNEENNNLNNEEFNNNRYNKKKISKNWNFNEDINGSEKANINKVTFINKNLEELEDYKSKTKTIYKSIPNKL